jgi:hypothetical protein
MLLGWLSGFCLPEQRAGKKEKIFFKRLIESAKFRRRTRSKGERGEA